MPGKTVFPLTSNHVYPAILIHDSTPGTGGGAGDGSKFEQGQVVTTEVDSSLSQVLKKSPSGGVGLLLSLIQLHSQHPQQLYLHLELGGSSWWWCGCWWWWWGETGGRVLPLPPLRPPAFGGETTVAERMRMAVPIRIQSLSI